MFKERLISGIILVIIAVVTLYLGGFPTWIVTMGISLIGVYELMSVIKREKSALAVIIYTGSILYYILILMSLEQYILPLLLFVLMLLFAVYVFTFPKYVFGDVAISFFGLCYVTVMLSCIYQIRILQDGAYIIVLVFLSAWGNDTLAYCAGRLFGKHKMSPVLSPKKTIEGAVGGVVGAGILGGLYSLFAKRYIMVSYNIAAAFVAVCVIGALISIVGDLGASAIKRNYDIKDYSNLIPGHGGILDRFDSIIFTAPVIYYVLTMVVGLK